MRVLDEEGADLDNYLALHDSGLAVAAAPHDPLDRHRVDTERLQGVLERLSRQFDTVLVDSSGTLSEVSQAVIEVSSLVLWVTTSDDGKAKAGPTRKAETAQAVSATEEAKA